MSNEGDRIVRFGEFELDKRRRLLRRTVDGREVPLTPRVFDTLLHLVEHPGELVDKRTLLDAVWPNVVVEENNLTQAVSTLRRALGEQPRQHHYIATVPGRGYRFVAEVLSVSEAAGPNAAVPDASAALPGPELAAPPNAATTERRPRAGAFRIAGYAAAAVALFGAALLVRQIVGSNDAIPDPDVVYLRDQRLLTERRADHRQPTLSPDGSLVAFVSDETGTDQIYVQNLADGGPLRITDIAGGAEHPSWSPNSDRIVFHSSADESIWSVGVLGQPAPRRLINEGRDPSFSFDGNTIVYQHGQEIRLADSDGSNQRSVAGVPFRDWSFYSMFPSLSPDGREIVFFRQQFGPVGDYWIVPAAGGVPQRLTFDESEGGRPTWSADGYVYFPSEREGTRTIWRLPAAGGAPQSVTSSVGADDDPAVSRDATRIVYSNRRVETSLIVWDPETNEKSEVYRSRLKISFPKPSHDRGRIAFFQKSDPEEQIFLMSSDDWQATQLTFAARGERRIMPRWSPDDREIYYYQVIPDSNSWSLHALSIDGGPSRQVFPEFAWVSNKDIEWSPSGDRVVYVRRDPLDPSDLGTSRVVIRQLATGSETELGWPIKFAPAWSSDGQQVLGTAPDQVYVCAVGGSGCQLVYEAPRGETLVAADAELGQYARWSSDETRIFFNRPTDRLGILELWVVDPDGGSPRRLFEYGPVDVLDGRFQVLSGDRILWNETVRDQYSELWSATLSRSDNRS